MKDFFKIIIVTIIVTLIGAIGMWGFYTMESDTEVGWKIWGGLLAVAIIVVPCSRFWSNQVADVIDLEL